VGSVSVDRLSGRTIEVLRMAACGPSNARFADALQISRATVKRLLADAHENPQEARATRRPAPIQNPITGLTPMPTSGTGNAPNSGVRVEKTK
jgi:transcriptional regulator